MGMRVALSWMSSFTCLKSLVRNKKGIEEATALENLTPILVVHSITKLNAVSQLIIITCNGGEK